MQSLIRRDHDNLSIHQRGFIYSNGQSRLSEESVIPKVLPRMVLKDRIPSVFPPSAYGPALLPVSGPHYHLPKRFRRSVR